MYMWVYCNFSERIVNQIRYRRVTQGINEGTGKSGDQNDSSDINRKFPPPNGQIKLYLLQSPI